MAIEDAISLTRQPTPAEGVSPGGPAARGAPESSDQRPAAGEPSGQCADDASPVAADDKTVISKRPLEVEALPAAVPTQPPFGQSFVGKRLEHYELNEFVGGGGMGAVFRATDTRLGRTVAVKVLSRDQTDEETIRRFRNEAQSAARLDHPNIARVYYVGEDHGWNFIVFEFIEGTNLRDAVEQNGPLAVEDALHYSLQVAEALAHSSSRDVIHRDIKPSNVLVMASGQVKLVDMGLARLHQVESSSSDLTASGVTLGTFDYISPEQARDPRSADVRSDIYSLGCTLYYMLTGRPPFPDGTALQKLIRHSSDEPPDVRIFRPELPSPVATLVAKMLAKRPAQRQQSAAALMVDILAVGQQLGLARITQHGQVVVTAATRGEQTWAKTWQIIAAVAVLALAIVLLENFLPSGGATGDVAFGPKFSEPRSIATDRTTAERPVAAAPASATATVAAARETVISSASAQGRPPDTGSNADAAQDVTPTVIASAAFSLGVAEPPEEAGIGSELSDVEISVSPVPAATIAPAERVKPKRIVVTAAVPGSFDPESEYVATLHDACRRAAALGLTDVELGFNGRLVEKPLDIVSPRLVIRAAAGFKPIVVFQPSVAERQMVRLAGGGSSRLSIQRVELRMELPAEPADNWSLIAMGTGQALELADCVLTVQDGDAERSPIHDQHDQVAMISVQPRRAGDTMTMMDPQAVMVQSATVTLDRSIARGEATFVVLTDETPLRLHWKQGLLVTSRRLIETGGSATDPKFIEKIEIYLDSVTAICRQGLYQMRRGAGKDYQYAADITTAHCILTTEPAVPLYEFIGVTSVSDVDLRCTGDFNRYPNADVIFLRVRSGVPGEKEQDKELDVLPWSSETNAQVGIPWLHRPPQDVPAHALGKADFVIDAGLASGAGFDPMQLPDTSASSSSAASPFVPASTPSHAPAPTHQQP